MGYRLAITIRYVVAVLAIASLFTLAEAGPARHLSAIAAFAFWMLSVGVGLALAIASVACLTKWAGTRRLPRWRLISLAGVMGLLLYTPLSLSIEVAFPPPTLDDADGNFLDELESAGGTAALVAELLQAGPLYLLTWALLNLAPATALNRSAVVTAAPAVLPPPPRIGPPEPVTLTVTTDADAAEPSPSPARRAAEELGWPVALGQEPLSVSADLHYLHVSTALGRATVLGSLAAVESHFIDHIGSRGLPYAASHEERAAGAASCTMASACRSAAAAWQRCARCLAATSCLATTDDERAITSAALAA
jgi:hypothetical protein